MEGRIRPAGLVFATCVLKDPCGEEKIKYCWAQMHAKDVAPNQSQRSLHTISIKLRGDLFRKVPGYSDTLSFISLCLVVCHSLRLSALSTTPLLMCSR